MTSDDNFRLMLAVFCGCVNPRSFMGNFLKENQGAVLEKVISRLVNRTEFEVEGWKRILPFCQMLAKFKIEIDTMSMESEIVRHSLSDKIEYVWDEFQTTGNQELRRRF